MKRRRFIVCLCGSAVVGAVGLRNGIHGFTKQEALAKGLTPVSRKLWALGAESTFMVYHEDKELANKALNAAVKELETIEQVMSLYRADSEISVLNRTGLLEKPNFRIIEVLEKANEIALHSGGAFDITVQPLWALYKASHSKGEIPSEKAISKCLAKVDFRNLQISKERVAFKKAGMAITLNGIAQGYAADRIRSTLQSFGITHALVDSGEISAIGTKPSQEEWKIAIKHPRKKNGVFGVTTLSGKSASTSGDYESYFSSDFKHHHILNPKTGVSPQDLASVTIISDKSVDADALSTAALLVGSEKTSEMLSNYPESGALLVRKNGEQEVLGNINLLS